MLRKSSKPTQPCESRAGRVRFPCPTDDLAGRQQTPKDVTGHHRVSTPKVTLFELWEGADRARLFGSVTPEPNTGCYLWQGRATKQGYGVVSIACKTVPVHRAVYRLCVEDITDDLDVHHVCEQPGCINPEHLVALTPQQHRRVHLGLAKTWNVFKQRFRADPFERGVFGRPQAPCL